MPPKKKKPATKKNATDEESAPVETNEEAIKPAPKRRTRKQKKDEEKTDEVAPDAEPEPAAASEGTSNNLYPVLPEATQSPEEVSKPKRKNSKGKKLKPWQKTKEVEDDQTAQEEAEIPQKQESHPEEEHPNEPQDVAQSPIEKSAAPQQAPKEAEESPLKPLTKQSRKRAASTSNGNSPKRRETSKSNGNDPLTKPTPTRKPTNNMVNRPSPNLSELEQKFNKLKNLRETQVEKAFREYLETAEKRDKAHQEMLTQLSQQVARELEQQESPEEVANLKEEIENLQSELEESTNEVRVLQAKLAQTNDNSEPAKCLDLISDLSGLAIQNVETTDEGLVYDCLQSGRFGVLHYTLTDPQDESNEVTYSPLSDNQEEVLTNLPDYFLEPLSFARTAATQFYWKVSQALNKK